MNRHSVNRCFVLGLLTALVLPISGSALAAISCGVGTTGLAFGGYAPLGGLDTDSTVGVTVTCNSDSAGGGTVNYSIALDAGRNSAGLFTPRKLKSGVNPLDYYLYIPGSWSVVWGDNTSGTNRVTNALTLGLGDTKQVMHTGNARIPRRQLMAIPGSYADAIIITVTY